MRARTLGLVAALLPLALAGPLAGALGSPLVGGSDGCTPLEIVPLVGPACRVEGGWIVRLDDGTTLFTHGPDVAPAHGTFPWPVAGEPVPPDCVDASAGYYNHLLYVRPPDAPDRYAEMAPALRTLVAEANGLLMQEARAFGYRMAYEFLCKNGEVVVGNETGPADFTDLTRALAARGYGDPKVKYWVWYDESHLPYLGLATVRSDTSPGEDNINNGNADTSSWGVTYGILSSVVMMHESTHTLGVGHCVDGWDVMCSAYDEVACEPPRRFDCLSDEYFNPDPEPGSYLASHWNLGSGVNRYLAHAFVTRRPTADFTAACDGLACTFDARASTDPDGDALSFRWTFGDGTNATGDVVQHAFPSSAWWGVRLVATDAWGAQREEARPVLASVDDEPPVSRIGLSGTAGLVDGWYRWAVTVDLEASDADAGVDVVRWRTNGGAWRAYAPPLRVFDTGWHLFEVSAIDRVGNEEAPHNVSFGVDGWRPDVRIVHPNAGVYLDGRPVARHAALGGQAYLLYTDRASAMVRVEVHATDATSGIFDVVAYAGTDHLQEVCRGEPVGGDVWACEWPRAAVAGEDVTIEVRVRDYGGNVASQRVRTVE